MIERGGVTFKTISTGEKKKERMYLCIACGNEATQTALIEIQHAFLVERYCDTCASKYRQ
jgi:hypothetical protein